MGTSFGNMHVMTDNLDDVLEALTSLLEDKEQPVIPAGNLDGFESLLAVAYRGRNIFYLGQLQRGFVSILNDYFDWGEVEAVGEELSSYIQAPVMTISYFDDGVFTMTIYSNGEEVTGQVWCTEGARFDYELEDKKADISVLTEYLGHQHFDRLNEIMAMSDCEKAVEALQELLQIPLWIKSDWFDDIQDPELEGKYAKYDLNR
ncbi:hypothetical protein PCCS19_43500 [Paenibacillus sp. CCS19]|uniref:hypothetical protein n=1 Tax=Paenibacillus sp. CCS19 TaxID=3158387 RepID=UPI002569FAD2|nr:hypothetical protein [Paenibacillus cellulosilyticus]GMK41294.1 hypothetical protein PCCS19_43500 [Paenibacillus cellulosilyticus]